MSGFTQLTQEERYQIYILKKAEYSQTQIAELLERDKSTISRELRRNRGLKGYRPRQAHNLALRRRYDKAQPRIGNPVWQLVEALIRDEWSPEQIVGRVEMEQGVSISHEWIYQHVYTDKRSGGNLYRFRGVTRSDVNAMASIVGVARYPTRSRLMNARPLLMPSGVSVTGRATL